MIPSEIAPSRVLVFGGSTRLDSFNRKLAREAFTELKRAGLTAALAELRDYPMPIYDGDVESTDGLPSNAKAFKELLRGCDALVIASPEHNGFFPALIKNVIDWTSRAEPGEKPLAVWRGKTVVLLSTSPGPGAGRRALKQLRELLEGIGVKVLPEELSVPRASEAFDAGGSLTRSEDRAGLERVVADLATALATGKEAIA